MSELSSHQSGPPQKDGYKCYPGNSPAFLGTSVQEVALMAIELLDSFLRFVLRGTSSIRLRAGDDWTDKITLTFLC